MKQVEDKGYFYLTYFLNPREREILENLANAHFLKFFFSPENTEYTRVIIAPDYYELNQGDFEISLLEINYPNKFGTINHRQILGSFLNETGLQRREIGDIVNGERKAQIYVNSKLQDYFLDKVKEINHLALRIKEIPLSQRIEAEENFETLTILVSSLRLDKLISAGLTISRNLAVNMIQSRRIKVNYAEMDKNDFILHEGDLISIRGHGRIKILRQLGLSKKDKIKVEIEKIDNRKGR